MKNLKFVFIFAIASIVSLAIYSCSKENIEKKSITQALEFRTLCPSYIDVAGCNPPTTFSAVTQETKCTMFCQKIVNGTGIFITELLCGSGCCTRKTPFCVKGPGDIQYGTPIYENAAPCVNDNNWFYTMTCPAGSTSLEVCDTACSKI